jgi:dihydroneopterin aldolase
MTGVLELRGLRVLGICGALPEERQRRQPLEVDLDVVADLTRAMASDELGDTIDYGAVCGAVERVVHDESFTLLEGVAGRIAGVVLTDDRVESVTVSVRKLRPPVPQQLETAGVRLTVAR